MRGRWGTCRAFALDQVLDGWAVGQIVSSNADGFAVGESVLHMLGWRDYAVVDAGMARAPQKIAVDADTPDRWYLGPLGWSALTSYAGLFAVAEMRDDDVVFISGAAGAVGSLAVQIAKVTGHTVIGSAGTAEKVRYVAEELGAAAAFCYRDGPVGDLLARAAPDGIDVYFDNVGGDHLQAALDSLGCSAGSRCAGRSRPTTRPSRSPVHPTHSTPWPKASPSEGFSHACTPSTPTSSGPTCAAGWPTARSPTPRTS
jgi:NADPH-dependent curcumin reductase CurA